MEWGDCDPKVLLHDEQPPMRFETTPEKEAALPSQGLSVEDAEFLANFSDEARRKVIKKVSMGDLVWKLQDANIGPRLMYVRKMGSANPQP